MGSSRRQASSQGESESVAGAAEADGERREVAAVFVVEDEVGDGESRAGARLGGGGGGAVGEGAPFSQSASVIFPQKSRTGESLMVVRG